MNFLQMCLVGRQQEQDLVPQIDGEPNPDGFVFIQGFSLRGNILDLLSRFVGAFQDPA